MAFAFDTLAYANHLKKAGVDAKAAEAHAEAAREFIMAELVTKGDLVTLNASLESRFQLVDQKITAAVQSVTIRLGVMMVTAVTVIVAAIRIFA